MIRKTLYVPGMLICLLLLFALLDWQTHAESGAVTGPPDLGFLQEYDLPAGAPFNIVVETVGPPASVWYTLPDINAIGHLVVTDTTNYMAETYPIPTANSQPYDLVYDGVSRIWFTENAGNKLGRLTIPGGSITEYVIPTPNSAPTGIGVAPDGSVWFLERDGNKLGRFNPTSESFQEFTYETAGGQLEDIAVLNNNSIWFTAPPLNRASNYRVDLDDFVNVPVNSGPGGTPFPPGDIVTGNNQVWISSPSRNWAGIHFPGTLSFWRWVPLLVSGGEPQGLAFSSPDGLTHIWYVQTAAGWVGKFVTNPQGQIFYHWADPLPTAGSQPRGIAVAGNGHAWITEMGAGKIAEWRPPTSFYRVFLPIIGKP